MSHLKFLKCRLVALTVVYFTHWVKLVLQFMCNAIYSNLTNFSVFLHKRSNDNLSLLLDTFSGNFMRKYFQGN